MRRECPDGVQKEGQRRRQEEKGQKGYNLFVI